MFLSLSNQSFETSRYGRSDRHHGKDQSSERRPRRRRFSLRRNPSGRGPFVRPARTGGCCAGLEALVADTFAARRPLRHSPGRRRQQSRQAPSHSRGTAHRQAGLASHRLRPRGSTHRSGDSRALRVPRSGDARAVHRAGLTAATHSVGQNQIPNMLACTPPQLRAGRPTKSTTCH